MSDPAILAEPPSADCCKPGFIHSGEPKGETIKIAGFDTYAAHPPQPSKKVILAFPDAHGPFHINNQLLFDYFASQGFFVVAVDYFEGDPVQINRDKTGFDVMAWINPKLERAREIIAPKWIEAVIEKYGGTDMKFGTVGYCFGASFVMDIRATDKVKAGAFAHPSFLDENHFRKLKRPLLLACAEEDHTFSPESRHQSEELLKANQATYFYQLFSGVKHGFALRGNMEVEHERWAKEQSAYGMVSWWNRFLV
ncbi:hypothetical protein M422DRAFT_275274 [Sphaerobolus stellatus SS14]|uniref:Dienelactone hydrolase domain-containing protein n=1 Tax=Sphaerobolus stellatus (strain SS14) TaxID=990650 RepID=A0A0C9UEZ9_SPHS4|nr:hypothetical protein M422DRAFT_275274 [Sphaerobolus stellatus SS14]